MNNKQLLDEVECGMKSYPDQVGLICETQKVNIQMSRHIIYFELTVPCRLQKVNPLAISFTCRVFTVLSCKVPIMGVSN